MNPLPNIKLMSWNIEDSRQTMGTHIDFSKREKEIIKSLHYYLATVDILLIQEVRQEHLGIFGSFREKFHVISYPYNKVDENPMYLNTLVRKSKFDLILSKVLPYSQFPQASGEKFMHKRSISVAHISEKNTNNELVIVNTHNFLMEKEKWIAIQCWKELLDLEKNVPIIMGLDTNFFYDLEGEKMFEETLKFLECPDCYRFTAEFVDVSESISKGFSCYEDCEVRTGGSFLGYSNDKMKREISKDLMDMTPLDRIYYKNPEGGKYNVHVTNAGCHVYRKVVKFIDPDSRISKFSDEERDSLPSDHVPISIEFYIK